MVILSEFVPGSTTQRYDVLISFRGADTRLSFTDHLYNALVDSDINTFLDDEEIETGEDLKPELENAIKSSRASIIVLSKNYATSTWCLDELVLILEQRLISDHIVIPIFYHVEPTDVRKQQSSFGDAMAGHRQRMEAETNAVKRSQWAQKMEKWNKALTQVADLKGKDVKDRQETKFIEEIVTNIHRRTGGPLTKNLPLLFGMEKSIKSITSWLKDRSTHNADILTIVGMGGIGKTSLARYVHGLHCHLFDRSSFLERIGAKCVVQVDGLLDLQKQLCSDISKTGPVQAHHILAYTSLIEKAVSRKKVFIVLDDIESVDQLYALLGKQGFKPGSKIIITTKDASLTEKYAAIHPRLQPKRTNHILKGLDWAASLQLLCHHAFMSNGPKEGYEEVSEKLTAYCVGHPLALKVLAESLYNKTVAEWEDCIIGLKEETDSHIKKALQVSFDSMPSDNDKELFKHIACFFVGKDRLFTETILNACGVRTLQGIRNLTDRCLLTIDSDNRLMMHQLLQDLGRDVVRQESPQKPWKRSRLWCNKESFKVLKQKKGKGNLLGLSLDMKLLEKEKMHGSVELKTDALSKMDNLMLLQLNYVQLNGSYENFPEELRWLCMHGFPLESIPSDLSMHNLVALDMSYSNIDSFDMYSSSNPQPPEQRQHLVGSCSKDRRILGSLKILNLSFCEQLHRLGGFIGLPALERLIVRNCICLTEICGSLDKCFDLVFIDMSYCIKLEMLPTAIAKLNKVRTLLLDGCNTRDSRIKVRETDSQEMVVDHSIGINSRTSCSAILASIPKELNFSVISFPRSLVRLSLANNNLSNESFPMDLSSLSLLKYLCLDGNPIVSLPNCVRSLPKIEELSMDDCHMLISIEHPPCTLKKLIFQKFNPIPSLQRIVFDTEMSPLKLSVPFRFFQYSSFEMEGMVKIQPMAGVEEKVLRALGWTNLDFIKKRLIGTYHWERGPERSQTQMYYEFGIFSTIYGGKEMPNWIRRRSKGSSISITIPSSPKKMLRGLNVCYVQRKKSSEKLFQYSTEAYGYPDHQLFYLPNIKISNITKKCTWIYKYFLDAGISVGGKWLTFLSHWMFGKNDMEAGDQITITVMRASYGRSLTNKCGVTVVYDDGSIMEEEEDALEYYKSWNHIIGGDLSSFQLTSGEYFLYSRHFFRSYRQIYEDGIDDEYKDENVVFQAFSNRKNPN